MNDILAFAFDQSPIPQLLICPYDNRIEAVNSEAEKLFGLEYSRFLESTASALFKHCLAELIVLSDEAIARGLALSDRLSIYSQQHSEQLPLEVSVKRCYRNNKIKLLFAVEDAIALQRRREQAEAQQHYRSGLVHWTRMAKGFQEFERENRLLLDAVGEGIYGVDANGLTTFLNPAAERMLGWRADELLGKNMHNTIHSHHQDGSHYPVSLCPIYRAFRDGIINFVDDEVFWTKDGGSINVEYTSTPIKDGDQVIGAVIIFHDVTEKRLAQKRLVDALQEVEALKKRLEAENAYLQEEINSEFNHHHIVGKSPAIMRVIQRIELVAPTDATTLIGGESGTGKELIARAIHELSQRSSRPLIRVNCAAIPAELFESEFFGHCKGAFTGANTDRPGRFELADGGTLFLDEVGEIPLALQGKLLRVLQEQQFERVGEAKTRSVNVRIIAATNRDLRALVEAGQFREDLYFRLNVFPVESVPLRKRIDDIPLLAQHFLLRACTRTKKPGLKIPLKQLSILERHSWPGNIRELENIIERQVILAKGEYLNFEELISDQAIVVEQDSGNNELILTHHQFKQQEKHNIQTALKNCRGKIFGKGGAAELLGMKPTTLASRIKRYSIDIQHYKHHAEA